MESRKRGSLTIRLRAALVIVLLSAACSPSAEQSSAASQTTITSAVASTMASPTAQSEPSPTPTARDIWDIAPFAPLDPGTYFIDADLDPSTPLRVVYEIPAEGWSMWIGAGRFNDDNGHVSVSITTVVNLVADGRRFPACCSRIRSRRRRHLGRRRLLCGRVSRRPPPSVLL